MSAPLRSVRSESAETNHRTAADSLVNRPASDFDPVALIVFGKLTGMPSRRGAIAPSSRLVPCQASTLKRVLMFVRLVAIAGRGSPWSMLANNSVKQLGDKKRCQRLARCDVPSSSRSLRAQNREIYCRRHARC
jgi:hypothetical protein